MGNQVPPEYSVGCQWCEGVKWAAGKGPQYVTTSVSGVKKCDGVSPLVPDGNGSYLLEYVTACEYGFNGYEHAVTWYPGPSESWLHVWDQNFLFYWFHGWSAGQCADPFVNLNHCPGDDTEGGSANPSPHDGPTQIFNTDYGFFPEPYYEYEKWDIGNLKYMFRICDGTGRVNVLFKWDRRAKLNI